MVVATNLTKQSPEFFYSMNPYSNPYAEEAVLASSAAPTYLPAYSIIDQDDHNHTESLYADGGLTSNNPAYDAWLFRYAAIEGYYLENGTGETKGPFREFDEKEALIISIGTGHVRSKPMNHLRRSGLLCWATPSIDLLMDAPAILGHQRLARMFAKTRQYFRIDPTLTSIIPLNDASKVDDLIQQAKDYFGRSPKELRDLLSRLPGGTHYEGEFSQYVINALKAQNFYDSVLAMIEEEERD